MIKLFFSYSHRDEDLRNELETHLSALKRQGIIESWHDRRIGAGTELKNEISSHLESAQIILLLISPYFIASDYCYDVEMNRSIEMHESGQARIIPVILHPCDWKDLPFGKLLAVPTDGKPVSKFPNQHDAFLEITMAIKDAAANFQSDFVLSEVMPLPTNLSNNVPKATSEIRSSNLRVKRTFTDREKDKFESEAFEYIAKYFEGSLKELEHRNSPIETTFRRVDANHFSVSVYNNGAEVVGCTLAFKEKGMMFQGGITMSYGPARASSHVVEALSVEDDGYSLFLKQSGFAGYSYGDDRTLSLEGAAEYYWSKLIKPLQSD